jgi:hypothetical protein
MMRRLRATWSGLLSLLVRQKTIVVALLSVLASVAGTLTAQEGTRILGWGALPIIIFLIVLVGAVPSRYAAEPMLAYMLPTIHRLLELERSERITVHYLKSAADQQYEQLTEYYPKPETSSRGRTFTFTHGIVGQCFNTIQKRCWAVPEGKSFEQAMVDRWSFNKEQLARLTQDRRSFMVYPLGQEGVYARAVLYLDSDKPDRFTEAKCGEYCAAIEEYFLAQLNEALRRT